MIEFTFITDPSALISELRDELAEQMDIFERKAKELAETHQCLMTVPYYSNATQVLVKEHDVIREELRAARDRIHNALRKLGGLAEALQKNDGPGKS